uniref:hypothetical protein n=1 Tax=Vibrio cholerae TaxID=666 RepID=UPI003F5810F4
MSAQQNQGYVSSVTKIKETKFHYIKAYQSNRSDFYLYQKVMRQTAHSEQLTI